MRSRFTEFELIQDKKFTADNKEEHNTCDDISEVSVCDSTIRHDLSHALLQKYDQIRGKNHKDRIKFRQP